MRLPESTFRTHIAVDHPEVPNSEVVRQVVEDPDYILADPTRKPGILGSLYYRLGLVGGPFRNMNLAAAVEWEEADSGCVKTAYVTPQPVNRGQLEWMRPRRR